MKIKQRTARRDIISITMPLANRILLISKITMHSAIKLFKKCAKIGTSILPVFKYKIAIQIAKINADVTDPKLCKNANNNEEITIENEIEVNALNLFNKTPLKINSSKIGEKNTVVIKPPKINKELFI